jgi:hypothetical protein
MYSSYKMYSFKSCQFPTLTTLPEVQNLPDKLFFLEIQTEF